MNREATAAFGTVIVVGGLVLVMGMLIMTGSDDALRFGTVDTPAGDAVITDDTDPSTVRRASSTSLSGSASASVAADRSSPHDDASSFVEILVVDETGRPLENIDVVLRRDTFYTDAAGLVRLSRVPAFVHLRHPNYVAEKRWVPELPTERTTVTMRRGVGHVLTLVDSETRAPIAGVSVRFRITAIRMIETKSDGAIRFSTVDGKWPSLQVVATDYSLPTKPIVLGEAPREQELVLVPVARLRIRFGVFRPKYVESDRFCRLAVFAGGHFLSLPPDENEIVVPVVFGNYSVRTFAQTQELYGPTQGRLFDHQLVTVSSGGIRDVTLFSTPATTLVVRVPGGADEVTVETAMLSPGWRIPSESRGERFQFRGLPVGAYQVEARRDGRRIAREEIDIDASSDFVEHVMRIAPGALAVTSSESLRIVVHDQEGPVRIGNTLPTKPTITFEGLEPGPHEIWFGRDQKVGRTTVMIGKDRVERRLALSDAEPRHRLSVMSSSIYVAILTPSGWNLVDDQFGMSDEEDLDFERIELMASKGNFEWELPPGDYRVASGDGTKGQMVRLDRDREIAVAPVSSTWVYVTCRDGARYLRSEWVTLSIPDRPKSWVQGSGWTDGAGRLRFPVRPGTTYGFETRDGRHALWTAPKTVAYGHTSEAHFR